MFTDERVISIIKKTTIFLFFIITLLFTSSVKAQSISDVDIYINTTEEAQQLFEYTYENLPDNYDGYCGTYVHDMAVVLGIMKPESGSYDGQIWFNSYKNKTGRIMLSNNWTYECFEGEQCLNDILKKYNNEVYNLIFSMENTGPYGHAVFVNAIIDDTVYFTESYDTQFASNKQMSIIPLETFIAYYFESNNCFCNGGIIHFYEEDFYLLNTTISQLTAIEMKNNWLRKINTNEYSPIVSIFKNVLSEHLNVNIPATPNKTLLYKYKYFSNSNNTTEINVATQ